MSSVLNGKEKVKPLHRTTNSQCSREYIFGIYWVIFMSIVYMNDVHIMQYSAVT